MFWTLVGFFTLAFALTIATWMFFERYKPPMSSFQPFLDSFIKFASIQQSHYQPEKVKGIPKVVTLTSKIASFFGRKMLSGVKNTALSSFSQSLERTGFDLGAVHLVIVFLEDRRIFVLGVLGTWLPVREQKMLKDKQQ